MKTLKEYLSDWQDWDVASFQLGICLGYWEEDDYLKVKGIIWSANPVGDTITNFLEELVKAGTLERCEEPDIGFRWIK